MNETNNLLKLLISDTREYRYIFIKKEKMPKDLHFLPLEQCPSCGDIGMECYPNPDNKKGWLFYCPFCTTHWKVEFTNKMERRR